MRMSANVDFTSTHKYQIPIPEHNNISTHNYTVLGNIKFLRALGTMILIIFN